MLEKFIIYLLTVRELRPLTVKAYRTDIAQFHSLSTEKILREGRADN